MEETCPRCNGSKKDPRLIGAPCIECNGKGYIDVSTSISLDVAHTSIEVEKEDAEPVASDVSIHSWQQEYDADENESNPGFDIALFEASDDVEISYSATTFEAENLNDSAGENEAADFEGSDFNFSQSDIDAAEICFDQEYDGQDFDFDGFDSEPD